MRDNLEEGNLTSYLGIHSSYFMKNFLRISWITGIPTANGLQAYLGDIVDLVLDLHNKLNIAVKQVM